MMRFGILLLIALLLAGGCNKPADEAATVPQGKETVTAKSPDKSAGGGTKGITEDQIELGPGIQNAESRAGSKIGGN